MKQYVFTEDERAQQTIDIKKLFVDIYGETKAVEMLKKMMDRAKELEELERV